MVAVRALTLATAKAMLTLVLGMTVAIERTAVADAEHRCATRMAHGRTRGARWFAHACLHPVLARSSPRSSRGAPRYASHASSAP